MVNNIGCGQAQNGEITHQGPNSTLSHTQKPLNLLIPPAWSKSLLSHPHLWGLRGSLSTPDCKCYNSVYFTVVFKQYRKVPLDHVTIHTTCNMWLGGVGLMPWHYPPLRCICDAYMVKKRKSKSRNIELKFYQWMFVIATLKWAMCTFRKKERRKSGRNKECGAVTLK